MDRDKPAELSPEDRAAEIIGTVGPRIVDLVHQAEALLASAAPIGHKHARIVQITEAFSRTITPHVECRNGCSHCCHMATSINALEARAIERYTGRKAIPQNRAGVPIPGLGEALRGRYSGVACTFLVEGRCSVYPVRPYACRLHHSLEPRSDACDIHAHPGHRVASLNLPMDAIIAQITMYEDRGDIREFFPPA